MATNGFEQVFINTTNEQLQKVFNDLVFEAEAEESTPVLQVPFNLWRASLGGRVRV